jgi:Type II CAAX prenyl endopeptidase Rce1-like
MRKNTQSSGHVAGIPWLVRYAPLVPANRGNWDMQGSELILSAATVISTAAYIWLLGAKTRCAVVLPIAFTLLLWYRQSQTIESLGLRLSTFTLSLQRWSVLWIVTAALFVMLGWNTLFNLKAVWRGGLYLVWCVLQQLVYQSVVYSVLRKYMKSSWAAITSGVVFSLLHAPNLVLMLGTLVWGTLSSMLFEDCRTVLSLALLQVMLSSMLMWLTPVQLHHRFRVGPSYYLLQSSTGGECIASINGILPRSGCRPLWIQSER